MNRDLIIYLVHGTFAEGAKWTGEEGLFAAEVQEKIPGTVVRSIRWGGKNSHDARISGARKLASEVKSDLRDNPDRSVFFVGHSHGGNVALYAAADAQVRRATRGMAFLGTPFIHVQLHDPKEFSRAFAVTLSWAFVIILLFLGSFLFAGLGTLFWGYEGEILAFLAVPFAAVYGWFLREPLSRRLADRIEAFGQRALPLAKALQPLRPPSPTFVASVLLDEAGVGLRVLERLGSAPLRVSYLGAHATMAIAVALMTLGMIIGSLQGLGLMVEVDDAAVKYPVSALMMAAGIAVLVPVPALFWAGAWRWKAFGPEGLSLQAAARVRVTANPWWSEPEEDVRRRVPLPLTYWLRRKLRHSFFYEDPRLVAEIVDWILRVQRAEDEHVPAPALPGQDLTPERRRLRNRVWAWAFALTIIVYLVLSVG
jgi:hypothetical protein